MRIGFLYTRSELTPWKENVNEQTLQYLKEQSPDKILTDIIHFEGFTSNMLERLQQFDLVFNLCYGYLDAGQVEVAGWLEQNEIAHTASSYEALSMAQNKALLPEICSNLGINTPEITFESELLEEEKIYVVKPRLGSCHRNIFINTGAWMRSNNDILAKDSIFQPYIFGREFSVAVIPTPGGRYFHGLPPVEIYPLDDISIFIAGQNYGPTKREFQPNIPESISDDLITAAEVLHKEIGLRGMSRTDFRVDDKGKIFVLDVNAMPNLDPVRSLMPGICQYHGIQMKDLIQRIIDMCLLDQVKAGDLSHRKGLELLSLAK